MAWSTERFIGLKPVFSAMLEARRSGEAVNMLGEDWLPMMVILMGI